MTQYKIVHTPFTTGEPEVIDDDDMDLDEAKARLEKRAERIEKQYPGCEVDWLSDALFEVTDDTAVMIGDYQGKYYIVSEDEPKDFFEDNEGDEHQEQET